jgi:hypothetical protein
MPVVKNKSTEENRAFWRHVEEVSREVEGLVRSNGNGGNQDIRCTERNASERVRESGQRSKDK